MEEPILQSSGKIFLDPGFSPEGEKTLKVRSGCWPSGHTLNHRQDRSLEPHGEIRKGGKHDERYGMVL